MCGRFVSRIDAALEREWALSGPPPSFASFNVAPGSAVPVVRQSREGDRRAELLRWGLIPFWARGQIPKFSTINARAETLQKAASYRTPWKRGQRCLFPVNGFYEWQQVSGRRVKQPWYIHVPGRSVFALGGLWDGSESADGTVLESATIVTVPANELLAEIHNTKKRMPLIIPPERFSSWLGRENDPAETCLSPFPAALMEAWPVSIHVNNPAHDDPRCVEAAGG